VQFTRCSRTGNRRAGANLAQARAVSLIAGRMITPSCLHGNGLRSTRTS
jgi:hypothetical protein